MTTTDHKSESARQERFERTLLESAQADELPHEATPRAWATFSRATAVLAAASLREKVASDSAGRLSATRPEALGHTAKWLIIGALAGVVVTATWFEGRESAPSPSPAVSGVSRTPREPSPVPLSPAEPRAPAHDHEGAPESTVKPLRLAPTPGSAADTLAAQVRAIDAARSAISQGDADEALRRVAGYRRLYPKGELRADAEVVALEALAAQGDSAALRRQAAIFLAKYPNDPHAARVSRLLHEQVEIVHGDSPRSPR